MLSGATLLLYVSSLATAFVPPSSSLVSLRTRSTTTTLLRESDNNDNNNDNGDDDKLNDTSPMILDRFLSPKIDDPEMPLTEAGLSQIVAPSLQLFWLTLNGSVFPSWAQPLYDTTFSTMTPRGAFLAPTLIHGAGLACCWLLGCIAAKAFEEKAYQGTVKEVTLATIQAGAFACGLLILATQADLYREFGYLQVGDSVEGDLRIYRALVEVINDIFFQFITLMSFRLWRRTSVI